MYNAYVMRGNVVQLGNDITCDGFPRELYGVRVQTHVHADHMHEWESSMSRSVIMTPETKDLILAEQSGSSETYRSNLITHEANGAVINPGKGCASKIQLFNSGHMLGACMVGVSDFGRKYLYTSDFSWPLRDDVKRHLEKIYFDVLVLDASYGHPIQSVRNYSQATVREAFVREVRRILETASIRIIAHRGRLQHAYQLLNDELDLPNIIFTGSEHTEKTIDIYHRYLGMEGRQFKRQQDLNGNPPKKYIHLVDTRDAYGITASTSKEIVIRLKENRSQDSYFTLTDAGMQVSMTDHADFFGTVEMAKLIKPKGGILTVGTYAKELARYLSDVEGFQACSAIMPSESAA